MDSEKVYNVQYEGSQEYVKNIFTDNCIERKLVIRNGFIEMYESECGEVINHTLFEIDESNIDDLILALCNVKSYHMNKGHE